MQAQQKTWRLFPRTLLLFLALGVTPILLTTIIFALPTHWQTAQYKTVVGILLIVSTVSTLCLAGIVTSMLKRPVNILIAAHKEIEQGNLSHRMSAEGSQELRMLAGGFNSMARSVELATEREKQIAEEKSFAEIAAQVVHDLRSPLTSLQTASKYFGTKPDPEPEYKEVLRLLERGTQRICLITDGLLEQRNKHLRGTAIDLNDAIGEIINDYRMTATSGITIEANLAPSKPRVRARKIDVQRAVSNIINNALEAMGPVGALTISTDSDDAFAIIKIQDTGAGMSKEVLKKVLEGNFTYAKAGGSGIGMTVVREVLKRYHGILTADSTLGHGTSFVIKLPSS